MLTCSACGDSSGDFVLCAYCRKFGTKAQKDKAIKRWHEIVCEGEPYCFHCRRPFSRDMLCGDHIITKGARPDLKFCVLVGVPCCAACNTSGNKNRQPPPEELIERLSKIIPN